MNRNVPVALMIIFAVAFQIFAFDKKREWQEGKLLDISSEPYATQTVFGDTSNRERIIYKIDDGKFIYFISHLHFRRDPALPLTINTKVKFAIDKNKAWLMDDEGKEHDMKFEKKALKESEK